MTKLKPHEIFMAGIATGSFIFEGHEANGCPLDALLREFEDHIKIDFFEFTGVKWPDDVSVIDCWNKVVADDNT